MNFKDVAKLAVIRSKLSKLKLHSNLLNIKWEVVPASVCKYMSMRIDSKTNVPILEVSDEVLNSNSLDTIVVMFIHEFSHRIFRHFEKRNAYLDTQSGRLLSLLEYNLIADFVIDDFLANNTNSIKLDYDIRSLLQSHLVAVNNYYNDLYIKYVETFKSVECFFKDDVEFMAMYDLANENILTHDKLPNMVSYTYAYEFNGESYIRKIHTFDNMVSTSSMIKKMIIKMRKTREELEKNSQDDQEAENTNSQQSENSMLTPNGRGDDIDDKTPRQDNSIIDPTLPDDENNIDCDNDVTTDDSDAKDDTDIIDKNKDYQKDASDKLIEDFYKYHNEDYRQKYIDDCKKRVDKLNETQTQLSDSIDGSNVDNLPETLHDTNIVSNEIATDELSIHKNNQFNKVLNKIYTRIGSYGDNATKLDYVWRNPRSLMYLQNDYLIQDVKEVERVGKKKIAVYIDKSASMGMGPAKVVNSILQTFSKDLIDVDIWFWNDDVRRKHDTKKYEPYKIDDLIHGAYPKSDGCTSLSNVHYHIYNTYANESELTIITISDFEDAHSASIMENHNYNPSKNKHWQYLNVHIITKEYEGYNGFEKFAKLNAMLGVDNPTITTQILND